MLYYPFQPSFKSYKAVAPPTEKMKDPNVIYYPHAILRLKNRFSSLLYCFYPRKNSSSYPFNIFHKQMSLKRLKPPVFKKKLIAKLERKPLNKLYFG